MLNETKLDKTDRMILRELQLNSRISNAELADKVNLSPTPCLRRLRKLETNGVIQAYKAELNLQKSGFGISAIVFVQLTLNSTANACLFEDAIRDISRVQGCAVLAGRHDYLLNVVAKNLSDYEQLIKGELAAIPNIKNLESTIVLNQLSLDSCLPI